MRIMKKLRIFSGFKLLMILAFMWLVIGELIIFHQKRIYHVDFFEGKNLFIKPKTGDDEQGIFFTFKKSHLQLESSLQSAYLYSTNNTTAIYSIPYTPNFALNILKALCNASEYYANRAPPFYFLS